MSLSPVIVRTTLDAHVLLQRWASSQHSFGPWPPVALWPRGSVSIYSRTVNVQLVSLRVGLEPSMPHVRAGNEVADALADTGRIRGPAPFRRFAPSHLNSTRGLGQPRRVIQLYALLNWEAIDSLPDPMVQLPPPHAAADQSATSLIIATANVLTVYPQEEAQGETRAPSARRAVLAKQIREVGVDILGVQKGRSRKDHFVVCEGYAMWISAATPGLWRDGALDQHQRLRPHTRNRFNP